MEIDYERLGKGIYDLIPDDGRAVIAHGMIPVEWMDLATKMFRDKCGAVTCDRFEIDRNDADIKKFGDAVYPHIINDFQKNLTVAIFKAAKSEGNMIA